MNLEPVLQIILEVSIEAALMVVFQMSQIAPSCTQIPFLKREKFHLCDWD